MWGFGLVLQFARYLIVASTFVVLLVVGYAAVTLPLALLRSTFDGVTLVCGLLGGVVLAILGSRWLFRRMTGTTGEGGERTGVRTSAAPIAPRVPTPPTPQTSAPLRTSMPATSWGWRKWVIWATAAGVVACIHWYVSDVVGILARQVIEKNQSEYVVARVDVPLHASFSNSFQVPITLERASEQADEIVVLGRVDGYCLLGDCSIIVPRSERLGM